MNEQSISQRQIPDFPQFIDNKPETRKKLLAYLVQAGAQAPSWYNCQPWRFEQTNSGIELFIDNTRDQSFYNWGNFNTMLACGAAIRNILIAAKARGIAATLEPELEDESLLVARIDLSFEAPLQPSAEDLGREHAIWTRHTNTLLFDNMPLPEADFNTLNQAHRAYSDIGLHWLVETEDKEKLFAAASTAEQIRFARRDLHEQLHRMIRWTEAEAYVNKTGYTLPSMGACGFGKTFFRISRPWTVMRVLNYFGAHKNQAQRACSGLRHCAAIGVLTVKGCTQADLLLAGQAMQQLWLTATMQGLDLQPHNSFAQFFWAWRLGGDSLFNPQEQGVLQDAKKYYLQALPHVAGLDAETCVFLFRIGRGEPVHGYTLRRGFVFGE